MQNTLHMGSFYRNIVKYICKFSSKPDQRWSYFPQLEELVIMHIKKTHKYKLRLRFYLIQFNFISKALLTMGMVTNFTGI